MEGGLIERAWMRIYKVVPDKFDLLVQSWDCSFKGTSGSDLVAGQVWGRAGGRFYMLPYRVYERLDFGPTKNAIKVCHAKFPCAYAILIEDKANGSAMWRSPLRPTGKLLGRWVRLFLLPRYRRLRVWSYVAKRRDS